ncbi:unnamed protein product [Acanthoscelides obtectus]|nr:unnamed protein product [Acanthoscelides obtectus]CAK1626782.1 hypothetical protein AOBTE_LOCUS4073 [Acanthoscelides obtectus]
MEDLSNSRTESKPDFLAPDSVLEKVSENVKFRPFHGPKKHHLEPIMDRRLFVFNENVQVLGITDDCGGNTEKAAVRIEESPRKGFVKLREIDAKPPTMEEFVPFANSNSESETNSRSSSTDSDSQSMHGSISDLKTPQPIEIINYLESHTRNSIPASCVTYRRVKKTPSEIDIEGRCISDITEDDWYHTVCYFGSRSFMNHFKNYLFPNQVAPNLGFAEHEISQSKSIPGKIFCSKEGIPHEVIPALQCSWPSDQTLGFIMKGEKDNGKRKIRIFPTESMINEIRNMACALVPRGYFKKHGERLNSDIEWEIMFPQAERYLESYMSHAQIKCYLVLLAIHKTYIEPKTLNLGLLPEHIRCFMLWECETNYSDWPEHRLGTKLYNVVSNLYQHLAKGELYDYFVKEKNLFHNIQRKYLRLAQRVLHGILETPFVGCYKALRNLRYIDGKSFYPPLDLKKIYEILVDSKMKRSQEEVVKTIEIKDLNQLDVLELKWRQVQETKKKEELKKLEEIRRDSEDSIDMDWMCEKTLDLLKRQPLLSHFINFFIDLATKSSKISTKKQTLLYFKQARYLTRILKDEKHFMEEAEEFLDAINKTERECMKEFREAPGKTVTFDTSDFVIVNGNDTV